MHSYCRHRAQHGECSSPLFSCSAPFSFQAGLQCLCCAVCRAGPALRRKSSDCGLGADGRAAFWLCQPYSLQGWAGLSSGDGGATCREQTSALWHDKYELQSSVLGCAISLVEHFESQKELCIPEWKQKALLGFII